MPGSRRSTTDRRELRLRFAHPILVGDRLQGEPRRAGPSLCGGAAEQRRRIGILRQQRVQPVARPLWLLDPHRMRALLHQRFAQRLGQRRLDLQDKREPGHYLTFCLLSCASFCSR
jgi:hypothetical protein